MSRRPDFLIIGENKCGTTTLWSLLASSPRVSAGRAKELHGLGSYTRYGAAGPLWDGDARLRYLEHFKGLPDDCLVGDATPNYLADPLAAERAADVSPDARIIVLVRDPVDRAWSHYWHSRRGGLEDLSFADAIDREEERLGVAADHDSWECNGYFYRGLYAEHLEAWTRHFEARQIKVLEFSRLKTDARGCQIEAASHLGLDEAEMPAVRPVHANRARYPKSVAVDRMIRPLGRFVRKLPSPIGLPILALGAATRGLRSYSGTPRMDQSIRDRLRDRYAASDRRLEPWLGRLPDWLENRDA